MNEKKPIFIVLAEYTQRHGAGTIKDMVYHAKVGAWEFWINGTTDVANVGTPKPTFKLEPFHCYVEFNGWPAGIFNPNSGTFAAGDAANEDSFCEALETAA